MRISASGRVIAVLAFLFLVGVMILNAALKPDPGTPGAWLFDNSSRTLVITCTLLVAVEYLAFGLFIGYQHAADYFWPDRHSERIMRRLAADRPVQPAQSRPRRAATAPTAPLPKAPAEAPTVTVNEGAQHT